MPTTTPAMIGMLLCASLVTVLLASLGVLVLLLNKEGLLVLSLEGHCEVASFSSQQTTPYRVNCKASKIL
jgi:hypothetical protein